MRIGPFGPWGIFFILVVVLLFFGPKRLPEMAKGIGQSVREFRRGIRGVEPGAATETVDDAAPAQSSAPPKAEPVERG